MAVAQTLFESFIPTTIDNILRVYPNGILHQMTSDEDALPPHVLHPAFYGCYDWHSAVHSHWQLIRAIQSFPNAPFAAPALAALQQTLTAENLATEMTYVADRDHFEMPYGMAWLLQLCAELREWDTDQARQWLNWLTPLEDHAAAQFAKYLNKMPFPVRTGLHNQTAFSLGLVFDWAQTAGRPDLLDLIRTRGRDFYLADRNAPLAYEPSGSDFLSPALAEADLMRRVLDQDEFVMWLDGFFGVDAAQKLTSHWQPVGIADFSDGQLAHFTGLNMSRAWMLRKIGRALPDDHHLRTVLLELAQTHQEVGIPSVLHEDYMVSHWAPTFVVYLLTEA